MTQTILCPVCETDNAPDAKNCEVCGERLAPAAPGERVAPEEQVAAMIKEEAATAAAAVQPLAPAAGDVEPVFEFGDPSAQEQTIRGMPSPQPTQLYSPLTGEAYAPGSAHYDEGFGPMGEELVATLPAGGAGGAGVPQSPEVVGGGELGEAEFAQDTETSEVPVEEGALEEETKPEDVALPEPVALSTARSGGIAEPARLVLYVQKQPVKTYEITTDETLIGRRDIRADIDPEIDLTAWDEASLVSRKHAYLYRQNKNYILYAISQGGVQVNNDLLGLGDRRPLKDGDIVIVAGFLAMKFKLPAPPSDT